LDIDDEFSLDQAGLQAGVLLTQQGQFLGVWVGWYLFRTAWLRCERLELAGCTQSPPLDQMGGI
jgi:hypothetical protein